MNVNEMKELYANIDACSYVTKGESDSRETHFNFKVICGENLLKISAEFEKFALICKEKYEELVDPEYATFDCYANKLAESKDAEKKIEKLAKKYEKAIESHDTYQKWLLDVFFKQEVELPDLIMIDFADVPEKIAGGYLIAIKSMIKNFPEFK